MRPSTSRKYDVYGIGNALVDMEFEVEEDFIHKAKIAKGLMTLVDEARHHEINSALNGIEHKKTCAGSAANSIIAVSQFGGKSFYSCKVANDEIGEFYFRDLVRQSVDTNLSSSDLESGITGKCIVLVTPDGERTMNTFLGITSDFSPKELVEEHLKDSNYLFIEGYLIASPTGKQAMIEAKNLAVAHDVKVAITFSDVKMIEFFGDGLRELIGEGIDLVFCNEAEALAYTDTEDIKEAAAALKKITKAFAITLGPKGALVFDGTEEIIIPSHKVEVVNTNGAGDCFAGAVLYAINNGMTLEEAAKLGCAASSTLVTQFGSRLHQEQVAQIKERFQQ